MNECDIIMNLYDDPIDPKAMLLINKHCQNCESCKILVSSWLQGPDESDYISEEKMNDIGERALASVLEKIKEKKSSGIPVVYGKKAPFDGNLAPKIAAGSNKKFAPIHFHENFADQGQLVLKERESDVLIFFDRLSQEDKLLVIGEFMSGDEKILDVRGSEPMISMEKVQFSRVNLIRIYRTNE